MTTLVVNGVSPTTVNNVSAELGDAVDRVPDDGPCEVGAESTIVDVTGEAPTVLRPDGVLREAPELCRSRDRAATSGCRVSVGPITCRVRAWSS